MIHVLRYTVLQSLLLAGVAALYLTGLAAKPFQGSSAYLCSIVLSVFGVGLVLALLKRWNDVRWVATHILRLGLLGTVIGLIIAFSAAGAANTDDPTALRGLLLHVVDGMFVALFVTLFGVGANLWLALNIKLLGHE